MRLIRRQDLEAKSGFRNKSTIYLLIEKGLLPRPIKVGRASLWVEAEVDEALKAMVERSRGGQPA